VAEPDVLLLDEPTNHLDADGVEWLQTYLDRFAGALVLVTHDRYLLDRVTRRIVAVEGGQARRYEGNYATYLARRAEEEEAETAGATKLRGTLPGCVRVRRLAAPSRRPACSASPPCRRRRCAGKRTACAWPPPAAASANG
jgi:ATPase subunit of ABC transporter with duplicated ATPase domains